MTLVQSKALRKERRGVDGRAPQKKIKDLNLATHGRELLVLQEEMARKTAEVDERGKGTQEHEYRCQCGLHKREEGVLNRRTELHRPFKALDTRWAHMTLESWGVKPAPLARGAASGSAR